MTTLLTGASGFIGSSILSKLDQNSTITLGRKAVGENHIDIDLASPAVVELPFEPYDTFVHCAGITPWSSSTPDYSQDLVMAKNVVAICQKSHVKRLIYVSGWNVYDQSHASPYVEDKTPVSPSEPYGRSKLATEEFLKSADNNLQVICLRLASVYGPGQTSSGLIPNLTIKALRGESIMINAKQTKRDYIYIDDVTDSVGKIISLELNDARIDLNLGGGSSVSIPDVANTIAATSLSLTSQSVPVTFSDEIKEGVPLDNQLSIEKAKDLGLLTHELSFETGINNYMAWLKDADIL